MHFAHALNPARHMVGRDALVERLLAARQAPCGIVVLHGPGGVGKSALVVEFIARAHIAGGFLWSFYEGPDPDAFMQALIRHIDGRGSSARGIGLMHETVRCLRGAGAFALVLDGLERMQDEGGSIEHRGLRFLLEHLAATEREIFTLCTSRLALPPRSGVVQIDVGPLTPDAAVDLLGRYGVAGPRAEMERLAETCAHHPLTLSLAASAVVQWLDGDAARGNEQLVADRSWLGRLEGALLTVAALYRRYLDERTLRVLETVGIFRRPVSVTGIAAVVRRDDPAPTVDHVEASLAELSALGLVDMVYNVAYTVHAAVRDVFPPLAYDAMSLHSRAADFLEARPGLGTVMDLGAMVEYIHHAVRAGRFEDASTMYWVRCGASSQIAMERGDHVRGEQMVRTLLGGIDDDHRPTWRPRLQNELAIYLDHQGRLEEARHAYLSALRARLREGRQGDACAILQNLADNARLQGRLPLAEKFAARAVQLTQGDGPKHRATAEDIFSAAGLLKLICFLRRGQVPSDLQEWRQNADIGTETTWVCDILIGRGDYAAAREMAVRNYQETVDRSAPISRLAALQATIASFWEMAGMVAEAPHSGGFHEASEARPNTPTLRREISHFALETSACAPLRSAREWAAQRGDIPLLCRALTFHATVCRLAGRLEEADASGLEAEHHARRHGLDLALLDALIERADLALERFGLRAASRKMTPKRARRDRHFKLAVHLLDEAAAIAHRPTVDSGPGRQRVDARLAEIARHLDGEPRLRLEARARPTPSLDRAVERTLCGTGPLRASVVVEGDGVLGCLPVEAAFADMALALAQCDSEDAVTEQAIRAWDAYYASHQLYPESVGPFYHLAVMLAMKGLWDHVALAGEDLGARGQPALGACLWMAARGRAQPREAALKLADALHNAIPGRVAAVTAYNLGTLHRAIGHALQATEAFERARQLDWTFALARTATQVDAEHARCVHRVEQVARALETWRRLSGDEFPPTLEALVPRWISMLPTCPDGVPYRYLAARGGARFLLRCPSHRIRHDSTLGRLDRPAPPDGDERRQDSSAAMPVRSLPPRALPIGHICLASHRVLKIVDAIL